MNSERKYPQDDSRDDDMRLRTARELLDVVRQENTVLQRLEAEALLDLLPRKEWLINRLLLQLNQRPTADGAGPGGGDLLGECLEEIRTVNENNHLLIEKSLQYWQDMLSVFVPKTYGKQGLQNMNVDRAVVRGAKVNREV